nr:carboxymuconolactone decarboxylase family protein [Jeotgalicoccus sp. WY2]
MRAFKKLQQEGYKANALDEKTKEYVALTYAIADKCEGCIGNHVKNLLNLVQRVKKSVISLR